MKAEGRLYDLSVFTGHRPAQWGSARTGLIGPMQGALRHPPPQRPDQTSTPRTPRPTLCD